MIFEYQFTKIFIHRYNDIQVLNAGRSVMLFLLHEKFISCIDKTCVNTIFFQDWKFFNDIFMKNSSCNIFKICSTEICIPLMIGFPVNTAGLFVILFNGVVSIF